MRNFTEAEHRKCFSIAIIKNFRWRFPTFDSLPENAKWYFSRLEDGSYVEKGAVELVEKIKRSTDDVIWELYIAAKKFEPYQLVLQNAVNKMNNISR